MAGDTLNVKAPPAPVEVVPFAFHVVPLSEYCRATVLPESPAPAVVFSVPLSVADCPGFTSGVDVCNVSAVPEDRGRLVHVAPASVDFRNVLLPPPAYIVLASATASV